MVLLEKFVSFDVEELVGITQKTPFEGVATQNFFY